MRDYFRNRQVLGSIRQLDVVVPEFFTNALKTGLVAYYKLDGNSNDSVGSNNGTDTSVSYVTGKINQSGSFNGSSSYMDLPTGIINATNSFSISFWIKINSLPTTNFGALILGKYNNTGSSGWNYGIPNININTEKTKDIIFSNRDGSGVVSSGTILTSPSINTWYDITFVYDRNVGTYGTNYVYLNGSLVSTVANLRLYTNYSNPIRLAKSQDYWQYAYYNGIIDELGIWSRALTSDEISQLYNSGAGLAYN